MTEVELPPGRRVVVAEFAEDPGAAIEHHVALFEQAPPAPASLGPRDVLIKICSAAVGWVDLLMTSGQYQHMPAPPYTPGLEYAGVVAWAGAAVPAGAAPLGSAVFVDGLLAGPRSLGAYQAYGGWASYAVAPAESVRPLPAGLSFDQACNLLGSYETAYHCLVTCGKLQPGETVLIHGASGATGLAAVHLAKLLGATVIATGRAQEKLAVVKAQGADHVLSCKSEDGTAGVRRFRDEVKALTGGAGVDVVYDGVGGDITVESLRCLKFGGRLLIVGWAATPNVARGKGLRGAPNANQLPTNLLMMKALTVQGCPTVLATLHDPSLRPPRLDRIMRWVAEGKIVPHVSHVFPLAEFKEAMRAKWRGEVIGGCVLRP
ncbi:MAG TPA: NADPH:quinone oxidoreductase family protein [Pseudomonadota bacterium]|nr:NADPH:quinone oxidoreductase family protein [Pseudomonadota bacterium]